MGFPQHLQVLLVQGFVVYGDPNILYMDITHPVFRLVLAHPPQRLVEGIVIVPPHQLTEPLHGESILLRRTVTHQPETTVTFLQQLLDNVLLRSKVMVLYSRRDRYSLCLFAFLLF